MTTPNHSTRKLLTTTLSLLAGVFLGSTAQAATPVVVWDGASTSDYNFSNLSKTGSNSITYTISNIGGDYMNTVATDGSYLQVGSQDRKRAIKVTAPSATTSTDKPFGSTNPGDGFTALVKYTNLPVTTPNRAVLAFLDDSSTAYIGVHTSGSTGRMIYAGGSNYGTVKSGAFTSGEHVVALSYIYTGVYKGTAYYVDGELIELNSGVCGSGFKNPSGIVIGGVDGDDSTMFYAETGMKILGIAIFNTRLTDDEIASYVWPSETSVSISGSTTSFSAINTAVANALTAKPSAVLVKLTLDADATVSADTALSLSVPVTFISSGSITLSAASAPDPSTYYNNADFSGIAGGLKRSWLDDTPIGFNFNSDQGSDGSLGGSETVWSSNANSASGNDTFFSDGLTKITWSSRNVWNDEQSGSNLAKGYLDDGNGVTVTVDNLPYDTYDVIIYASTDTDSVQLTAKTVNGVSYTYDYGNPLAAKVGTDAWGSSQSSATVAYGVNALRIANLTGSQLTITSTKSGSNRGCLSAIEIVPPAPGPVSCTLTDTAASWSANTGFTIEGGATWVDGDTASLEITNKLANAATFTFDKNITAASVAVIGSGDTTLALGSGTTASIGAYNFSEAIGLTKIDYNWGTATMAAGANTVVDTSKLGTGAISVGSGNKITYSGTTALPSLPSFGAAESGTVVVSARYSSTGSRLDMIGNHNNYRFGAGANISVQGFSFGNTGSVTQNVYQDGGSVTLTSTSNEVDDNDSQFLIGHYSHCTTKLYNYGGTLTCEGTCARLGWDGTTTEWYIGYGDSASNAVVKVKGIKAGLYRSNTAKLYIQKGGTLNLGSVGIQFSASADTLTFSGGTVSAYADTSIANTGTTTSTADTTTTFAPATGTTLTVRPALAGAGSFAIGGEGTVVLSTTPTTTGSFSIGASGILSLGSGVSLSRSLSWTSGAKLVVPEGTTGQICTTSMSDASGLTVYFGSTSGKQANVAVDGGKLLLTSYAYNVSENTDYATLIADDVASGAYVKGVMDVTVTLSDGAVLTLPASSSWATLTVTGSGSIAAADIDSLPTGLTIGTGVSLTVNVDVGDEPSQTTEKEIVERRLCSADFDISSQFTIVQELTSGTPVEGSKQSSPLTASSAQGDYYIYYSAGAVKLQYVKVTTRKFLPLAMTLGSTTDTSGTYITATRQLAFEGITLKDIRDNYCVRGLSGGASLENGLTVFGCNPYVHVVDGEIQWIRYEMQVLDDGWIKCVIVKLTQESDGVYAEALEAHHSKTQDASELGVRLLADSEVISYTSECESDQSDIAGGSTASSYGVYALTISRNTRLGDGITAYYPFTASSATMNGYAWNGTSMSLEHSSSLNFAITNRLVGFGHHPLFSSSNYPLSGAGNNCKAYDVSADSVYPVSGSASDWTISLWAKRNGASVVPPLYYYGTDASSAVSGKTTVAGNANGGIGIWNSGTVKAQFSVTTDGSSFSTYEITSASSYTWSNDLAYWHHVALVRSGTTVTLYVDGAATGSPVTIDEAAYLVKPTDAKLTLSRNEGLGPQNSLDDLCFWSRALTDAEISALNYKNSNRARPIMALAGFDYGEAQQSLTFSTSANAETDWSDLVWTREGGSGTKYSYEGIAASVDSSTTLNVALSDNATVTLPDSAITVGKLNVTGTGALVFQGCTSIIGDFEATAKFIFTGIRKLGGQNVALDMTGGTLNVNANETVYVDFADGMKGPAKTGENYILIKADWSTPEKMPDGNFRMVDSLWPKWRVKKEADGLHLYKRAAMGVVR